MSAQTKTDALHKKMEELGIREEDLIEKFILGSGSGGQKINKTSSCVYLKHIPTGIEVKCQEERSRELNRFLARRKLVEEFDRQVNSAKTKKMKEEEKIRRQKRRKSRKQKQKMIESKRNISAKKQMRSNPRESE